MIETSRRGFFKLLGGGVACAVLPSIVLAKSVIEIPVEFGWTWFIKPTDLPLELAKVIPNIMASNTQKIYDSTARDKHLLLDLKELPHSQVKLNLIYISEDDQNQRMIQRMNQRAAQKQKERIDYKNGIGNGRLYELSHEQFSPFYAPYEDIHGKLIEDELRKQDNRETIAKQLKDRYGDSYEQRSS